MNARNGIFKQIQMKNMNEGKTYRHGSLTATGANIPDEVMARRFWGYEIEQLLWISGSSLRVLLSLLQEQIRHFLSLYLREARRCTGKVSVYKHRWIRLGECLFATCIVACLILVLLSSITLHFSSHGGFRILFILTSKAEVSFIFFFCFI